MTHTTGTQRSSEQADAIRPFQKVNVPEAELTELRRRILATKWPERETVTDATQGVQLATIQALARYWATEYDWRKIEAKLNALPQFITEIDGLDIHFIHVRSKNPNALPMIVTHGWPGSIVEQLKIIDPLTNPTAHGGKESDAFDVVIPSIPGYGFSGRPTTTGWDPVHIARAWVVLMKRLGYTKFVAQGGDWGAVITDHMGLQAPPELLGIHTNMPGIFPDDIDKAAFSGAPAPSGLSADEKVAYERLQFVYQKGSNWLAFHEKIDRLVLISGHDSVDTMWRHYYKGTTKAAATAFWHLYPPAINPENVVSFPIAEKTPEYAASH